VDLVDGFEIGLSWLRKTVCQYRQQGDEMNTLLVSALPAKLPAVKVDGAGNVNPAMSFLRGRRSLKTKNTMASVLNSVAYMLSESSYENLDWSGFTADHVNLVMRFIRSTIDEQHESPTLAGLRERYFTYTTTHKSGPKGRRYRFGVEPEEFYWEAFSINTANLYLAAMKGIAKECYRLRQLHESEYLRIKDVSGYKTSGHDRGPLKVTAAHVLSVINECVDSGTNIGLRDAVILSLLYGAGLRRAEVRGLTMQSINWDAKELNFMGKGTKARVVPLLPKVMGVLKEWAVVRLKASPVGGALIVGVSKGDSLLVRYDRNDLVKPTGYNVTYDAVQRRFKSDLIGVSFGPHELRAVFGTSLLDNGVPINTVADLMGHENIQTTRIYDGGKEKRKRDGIALLPQG
tara:strand:- start:14326 stop:15534 length:1209 start_codon:yes stop_codon:yes gene_type:complete